MRPRSGALVIVSALLVSGVAARPSSAAPQARVPLMIGRLVVTAG